ncbi:inositol monophosphatase family protein [Aurantimonas sp. HBX-1]|uniref:inositol monophosphatase family protein n=1 Tax=Aurantimonas sp. HBX-1 TaxID=2906072 RepID=UPI001F3C6FEA|nr:inositol monophosphatase family protein [Aurantimonas sp. HBX-1]UIJ73525.1 inositol monophosphatase [Aurantimonas sp. HBX-1]
MPATIDIDRLADILREAAIAEIMPRFRNLGEGDIREKTSATDLVTEADEAAERFIARRCREIAPDALFVGEESVAADPALLDRLDDADLAIVVDPVDGTANFAAGLPLFAVMAAVVSRGETVAGIIYDPVGDDFMLAEKGAGAFQRTPTGAARILRTAPSLPLAEAIGCVSATYFPVAERAALLPRLGALKIVGNYRCAGHEYRLLASGGTHVSIYSKLMPWDHLAGCLLVAEAGGSFAMADGSPYTPRHRDGAIIAACSSELWTQARQGLLPA